jgi:hypothetical protein
MQTTQGPNLLECMYSTYMYMQAYISCNLTRVYRRFIRLPRFINTTSNISQPYYLHRGSMPFVYFYGPMGPGSPRCEQTTKPSFQIEANQSAHHVNATLCHRPNYPLTPLAASLLPAPPRDFGPHLSSSLAFLTFPAKIQNGVKSVPDRCSKWVVF